MRDPSASRSLRLVVALAAVALGSSCAREEPPPGATPDRVPPSVRELKPTLFAVVPGFSGSAEVRFDEPITGTSALQQQLVASPAGRYRVSAGFSNLKIEPEDGWKDGVVYYFQLPEGIGDLLGNRTDLPIDLVFSTGPEISSTLVTGEVRRRTDDVAVSPGNVVFYNLAGDSIPYGALTDREGAFELPYLPPDQYWSFGFQDLNRNYQLDRQFEPYDSARFELAVEGTARLSFRIVDPDTTPPVLGRIAVDGQRVELEFDDFLDPDQDFSAAGLVLRDVATGSRQEVSALGLQPEQAAGRGGRPDRRTEPDREEAGDRRGAPPADTTGVEGPPADTTGVEGMPADTTGVEGMPADTFAVAAVADRGQEAPPAGDQEAGEEVLPSRTLLLELAAPLPEGRLRLTIDAVVNLRGLRSAIDTTFAYPPEEGAADTPPNGGAPSNEGAAFNEGAAPDEAVPPPEEAEEAAERPEGDGRGEDSVLERRVGEDGLREERR